MKTLEGRFQHILHLHQNHWLRTMLGIDVEEEARRIERNEEDDHYWLYVALHQQR